MRAEALVDDQVFERLVDSLEDFGRFQGTDRGRDELAVGEEVVAIERFAVLLETVAKGSAGELGLVDQFVFDDVDVLLEVEDGAPVRISKAVQTQPLILPAQEAGVSILIEDIEIAVFGNVILKHTHAIGVDRSDEHRAELIQEGSPHGLLDPPGDPCLPAGRCSLGERERDDRFRIGALFDQRGDTT